MVREFAVVMVVHEGRVLLGYKKSKIGKGLWVGFGGKVEPGESCEESSIRELEEEAGLKAQNLEYAGLLWVTHEEHDEIWKIPIYRVTKFVGEPREIKSPPQNKLTISRPLCTNLQLFLGHQTLAVG